MRIDSYIFSEWVKAFIIALAAILGLLLIEDIQDDLPDFLKYGASPEEIFHYYALLTPVFLPILIPVALMISLLFALGNLHRNNEIIAMRAAGLSIFRITRSLWFASAMLSGMLLWLSAELLPQWREQARTMKTNYEFRSRAKQVSQDEIGLVYTITFDNQKDGRLWFLNRFSEYSEQGYGINVYLRDEEGREYSRIMAREGNYHHDGYWVFKEGHELTFDPDTHESLRKLTFDIRTFKDFTESPKLMTMLGKKPKSLSLIELRSLLQEFPPEENPDLSPYAVRYQSILSIPFSCFIVAGIAIPFAIGGPRTNPMVGVAKAVGLFAVYFFIDGLSALLGSQQIIGPVIAAWVPNAVMIVGAACLLWKKR